MSHQPSGSDDREERLDVVNSCHDLAKVPYEQQPLAYEQLVAELVVEEFEEERVGTALVVEGWAVVCIRDLQKCP